MEATAANRAVLTLALIVALCWSRSATAGPWTEPEGGTFVKLWAQGSLPTRHYWNAAGERAQATNGREYWDAAFGGYAEYGVVDWLTLAVDFSYWSIHSEGSSVPEEDFSYTFPGGYGLSTRIALLREPVAVSAHAGFRIPASFQRDPEPHPYGDGRITGDFLLLAGVRWGAGWSTASFGYQVIDERPADRLLTSATSGYRFHPWLKPEITLSFGHSLATHTGQQNPFVDLPHEQHLLDLKVRFAAELGLGFEVDVFYRRPLWAEGAFDSHQLGGGLSFWTDLVD